MTHMNDSEAALGPVLFSAEELLDAVRGYGPHGGSSDMDPYEALLDSIPPDEAPQFEPVLARSLSDTLVQFFSHEPTVKAAEKAFYNLCHLAACLSYPSVLGPTLSSLYATRPSWLWSRQYRGLPLANLLRIALTYNQHDRSLWPLWLAMLTSQNSREKGLPGVPIDGLEGAIRLPGKELGEPAWIELGIAVGKFAHNLEPHLDRRKQFHVAIEHLCNAYLDTVSELDLIKIADIGEWPEWAVDSLPRLFVPQRHGIGDARTYYVWAPTLKHVPDSISPKIQRSYCRERVLLCEESQERLSKYEEAFEKADVLRGTNRYFTLESTEKIVAHSLRRHNFNSCFG